LTTVPVWVLAFSTALILTLVATPLVRGLALATDLVDKPGNHKTHHIPTPYLGGIAVAVGVLIGIALDFQLSARGAAIAFTAAVLGAIGLVDDDRTVDPRYRFFAQFAAAATAAALGLRIHATGVGAIDVALTLLWIVGITNAFNLLDNMDGLTSGVAAVVAGAVFWLAILAQQAALATMAAALVGGCLGFLVYNRPPARIFLGDAGSLFVGFVIAVLTIDVTPALAPPFGFIVPLVLVGLPVLDTTTVTLSRLRRGLTVALGRRDHLSHRLVALGLSRRDAVLTLISAQAVLGVLAVLGGRRVIQLRSTALGALVVLAVLAAVTSRAQVYQEPVIGLPRKLKLAVGALLVAAPLLSLPALLSLARAAPPARAGDAALERALDALGGGDPSRTAADFGEAGRRFAEAEAHLDGPLVALGLVVPGVSPNLSASKTLVSSGQQLSEMGSRLAAVVDGGRPHVSNGYVPIEQVRALAVDLAELERSLRDFQKRVRTVNRPFLLPPLQHAIGELDRRVDGELATVQRAADSAELLPAILGAEGTRRYFLVFQNNAETPGGGGFIGNWGELVAENGRLQLARFGRPSDLNPVSSQSLELHVPSPFTARGIELQPHLFWQQVIAFPDFPTTARMISELYPQSGGRPIDGVIAIDPMGLSALLELTGPVTVPGWPEPISAGNVTDVVLRDAYRRFPTAEDQKRTEFVGELSRHVAQAFTTADLGQAGRVVHWLSKATRGGHLLVHLSRSDEQRLVEGMGADGAVPPVQGDSLIVVDQSVSADTVGPELRRTLRYDVALDPSSSPASLTGHLEVTLASTPAGGPGGGPSGPDGNGFVAGESRSYVSVFTPFDDVSATIEGRPVDPVSHPELGRRVHSTTVTVPALSHRTLAMEVDGTVRLSPDGWYRLDLLPEWSVAADPVEASVTVPRGWRVAETRGADVTDQRRAHVRVQLDRRHTVWVRVERTSDWARVVDRLRGR